MAKETLDILVQGGKATPAPPLGPSLSQLKMNVGEVVAKINEKTKSFQGMSVPVKVILDTETKDYEITVGTPPVSSMIKKEMGKEKLRHTKDEAEIEGGNIELSKIIEITKAKKDGFLSESLAASVKQVLGTCLSGGVTVDGKDPREIQKGISDGKIKIE
jgi:large subunit ribosomal protein L11